MIRPHHLGESSTFVGQTCALCKQEFVAADAIVICPEDGSRHHVHCWEANNNHCTAYGCTGQGVVGEPTTELPTAPPSPTAPPGRRPPSRPRVVPIMPDGQPARARPAPNRSGPRPGAARPIPNAPGSKVRTLPAGSFGCVRACFIVALIVAIILVALACAGAWFLTEYVAEPAASIYHADTVIALWMHSVLRGLVVI